MQLEKLKSLGGIAIVVLVLCALGALFGVFLKGAEWASHVLLPWLVSAGSWVLLTIVVLLLPLSIFRGMRGFTGSTIVYSSYIFGLITWLASIAITLDLWGAWAVVLGVMLFGGMVVPFALIASLFAGHWSSLVFVLVAFVLTWGARAIGVALTVSKHRA